jgi:predicted HTH transcriptional regulator
MIFSRDDKAAILSAWMDRQWLTEAYGETEELRQMLKDECAKEGKAVPEYVETMTRAQIINFRVGAVSQEEYEVDMTQRRKEAKERREKERSNKEFEEVVTELNSMTPAQWREEERRLDKEIQRLQKSRDEVAKRLAKT